MPELGRYTNTNIICPKWPQMQRAGKPGYTGYTGNTMLCQVYSRYTVGIQGCIQVGGIQGYTGKPGTPTILNHGVYRGYTAQRVYRGYTARIPGIALCVYRWGIQVGCQPSETATAIGLLNGTLGLAGGFWCALHAWHH